MDTSFLRSEYKQLRFSEYPFGTSASTRYLYLSPQHQTVLESTLRMIGLHQGLAVVEGLNGVGKSSIARRVAEILSDSHDAAGEELYPTVYIHTVAYRSSFSAISDIAERFAQIPPQRSELAAGRELERWLVAQRAAGRTPVLLLDDAQLLAPASLEAFQSIHNFDVEQKLLQVVFFGQTIELRELIAGNKGLLHRISTWNTLNPLSASDALAMINFRCQVAGRSAPLLEDDAYASLYHMSQGIPRTLVSLCAELLTVLERSGKLVAGLAEAEAAIANYQRRPVGKPATPAKPTPPAAPTSPKPRGKQKR